MTIKDTSGQIVSRLAVIARYFRKPDESLQDFNNQVKALTDADKDELAIGAAREMGMTVEQ